MLQECMQAVVGEWLASVMSRRVWNGHTWACAGMYRHVQAYMGMCRHIWTLQIVTSRKTLRPLLAHPPAGASSKFEQRHLQIPQEHATVLARGNEAAVRLGLTAADGRKDGCIPGCYRKEKQCLEVVSSG